MEEQAQILDEFENVRPEKDKFYRGFMFASSCYISFVALDFIVDLERFTIKYLDWEFALIILGLPIAGLLLISVGKKFGWVLSLLYYTFFAVLVFATIIGNFYYERHITMSNWKGYLLGLLSFLSSWFLVTMSVRKYFKISTALVVVVTSISTILSLTIYFLTME